MLFSFIWKIEYFTLFFNLLFEELQSSRLIVYLLGLSRIGIFINVEDYLSISTYCELKSPFKMLLLTALFLTTSKCSFPFRSSIEICFGIALSPILFGCVSLPPSTCIVLWRWAYLYGCIGYELKFRDSFLLWMTGGSSLSSSKCCWSLITMELLLFMESVRMEPAVLFCSY